MLTLILVALVAATIGGTLGMLVMAVCAAGGRPTPPVAEEPAPDPCAACQRTADALAQRRRVTGGF